MRRFEISKTVYRLICVILIALCIIAWHERAKAIQLGLEAAHLADEAWLSAAKMKKAQGSWGELYQAAKATCRADGTTVLVIAAEFDRAEVPVQAMVRCLPKPI